MSEANERVASLEAAIRRDLRVGGGICALLVAALIFTLVRPVRVQRRVDWSDVNAVLRAIYEARNPPPPGPRGLEPTPYDYAFGEWRSGIESTVHYLAKVGE